MTDIDRRLMRCFEAVFPTLSPDEIKNAVQDSTPQWDSLGSLMLARTVEEEFGIEADLEMMQHLSSFDQVHAFVTDNLARQSS